MAAGYLNAAYYWAGNAAEGTCDSSARGKIVMVQGAAGVADTFRICAKKADNSYGWFALATIP